MDFSAGDGPTRVPLFPKQNLGKCISYHSKKSHNTLIVPEVIIITVVGVGGGIHVFKGRSVCVW